MRTNQTTNMLVIVVPLLAALSSQVIQAQRPGTTQPPPSTSQPPPSTAKPAPGTAKPAPGTAKPAPGTAKPATPVSATAPVSLTDPAAVAAGIAPVGVATTPDYVIGPGDV